MLRLPGQTAGVEVAALQRSALVPPARYRVVVVPGSGCTGWVPLAPRYFAGLLHAELLVLHKPGADPSAGAGAACSAAFQASDDLAHWRAAAQSALAALGSGHPTATTDLRLLLVGISEGAELLPELANALPAVAGVVMVSAPGLDPVQAGELQAQRLDQAAAWQHLRAGQSGAWADETVVQGRTLRYWRSFWTWPLAQPLLAGPWPLLRVWGDGDEAVAPAAYTRFAVLAAHRAAPWCDVRLPQADHGLQTPTQDGVQWLWAQLERWARSPDAALCDVVTPP